MDPDEEITGLRPEFSVVTQPGEWQHWVMEGKTSRPPSFDCASRHGDILL